MTADLETTPRSLTGAHWLEAPHDARLAAGMVDATGMPQAVANMLAGRGITRQDVASWLDPKLRDLMPDPSVLTDLDTAVARLAAAVAAGEKVGIFGDYDVDGACAAALLHQVLTALGLDVSVHIPDRFSEGYGPNLPALMGLKDKGCHLIITVDCGITAHGPVAAAVEAGVEVLIIDHHIAGPDLPRAHAVVNPNRLEDDGQLGYLAAAGVVFLVLVGLVRRLRQDGVFDAAGAEPDLMALLDMVALATVADVVPLIGLNRAFIRAGLKVMAGRGRPGLAALADVSRLDAAPDVHSLGFMLGPRINAGGRIGQSSLGVDLLTAPDRMTADPIAGQLETLNIKRREIEQQVTDAAIMKAEEDTLQPMLLVAGENWNAGVIGISASRLKDRFNRPAAVISVDQDAEGRRIGKASARSLAPFHLGEAVIAAQQSGLLIAGGGHGMAAGFTIDMAHFDAFREFMNAKALAAFDGAEPVRELRYDSAIAAGHCSLDLINWLDLAGPYGSGFAEPRFRLNAVRLAGVMPMGKDKTHLRLRVEDATGRVPAVAFGVAGTALGEAINDAADGRPVDILGTIRRNRFNGNETVQLHLVDVAPAHNPE